jgi:hypothetical protein
MRLKDNYDPNLDTSNWEEGLAAALSTKILPECTIVHSQVASLLNLNIL